MNKRNNWVLRWESVHPFYRMDALFRGHAKKNILGSDYKKLMALSKDDVVRMYYLDEDLKRKSLEASEIFNDKVKVEDYLISSKENYKEMIRLIEDTILRIKYMSNKKIAKAYQDITDRLEILMCSYDLSRPEFFELIEQKIKHELKAKGVIELNKVFGILTTNTELTLLDKEEIEKLKITLEAKERSVDDKIIEHQQKYGWIGTSENKKGWDVEYYKRLVEEETKAKTQEIKDKINNKLNNKEKLNREQKEYLDKLQLTEETINHIEIVKEFSHLRLNIRLKWVYAGYLIDKIFDEIEHRTGADHLDRYKSEEVRELLLYGRSVNDKTIEERKDYGFLLDGKDIRSFFGSEVRRTEEMELENIKFNEDKEIKGNVANPGRINGIVKIISSIIGDQEKAIKEMQIGDVLVTGMTRPHLIEAIKKCGAIVTDEGGICSHAAIVSRELGKPCIVGTKFATKVLKDGDLVEVDAEKGTVRKIR